MSTGHPNILSEQTIAQLWGPYDVHEVEQWLVEKYAGQRKDKSPVESLLMLTRWSNHPTTQHQDATRWFKQIVDECMEWEWPLNAGVSEVYYMLGHLLAGPNTEPYAANRWADPDSMAQMLHWAQSLVVLKPFIRSSVGYQLEKAGMRLYAPHEQVLDTVLAQWMAVHSDSPIAFDMAPFWSSPLAQKSPRHLQFLVEKAPTTLPSAIRNFLLPLSKETSSLHLVYPPIFTMAPHLSNPNELLDVLVHCYITKEAPSCSAAKHLWDSLHLVWPAYTQLVVTFREMMGVDVFQKGHAMHSYLLESLRAIQQNRSVDELSLHGLLDTSP